MNALQALPIKGWIDHLSLSSRLAATRMAGRFAPRVSIFFETEKYEIKTATHPREIQEVLRLRHQIFFEEMQGRRKLFRVELDHFDFSCDHLLIIERGTQRVVGTYRLICNRFAREFYSEGEFQLSKFKALPGVKLELGRLCIDPDHRTGAVINLLWRGVTEYMKLTGARYLVGCSSIKVVEPEKIAGVTAYLNSLSALDDRYEVRPTPAYVPPETSTYSIPRPEEYASLLPPLVSSYLKAGARISPVPALDKDFSCIDFLTILDREELNPLFARRYFET